MALYPKRHRCENLKSYTVFIWSLSYLKQAATMIYREMLHHHLTEVHDVLRRIYDAYSPSNALLLLHLVKVAGTDRPNYFCASFPLVHLDI
jgi:hypothetical protein